MSWNTVEIKIVSAEMSRVFGDCYWMTFPCAEWVWPCENMVSTTYR